MKITDHVYLVGSEQFGLSDLLDCNMYLIDGGRDLALIDTGTGLGVDDVVRNIERSGFDPRAVRRIILTHAHAGHSGGAAALKARTGAALWAPRDGVAMIEDGTDPGIPINARLGVYPPGYVFAKTSVEVPITDGMLIEVGDLQLRALHVPGHTPDSTCYLLDNDARVLFTGDTLFYGGVVGIINLPGCSLDDYRTNLARLAGLGVDVLLPAHGVFVLRDGQKHVDLAIEAFADLTLPRTFFERHPFIHGRGANGRPALESRSPGR